MQPKMMTDRVIHAHRGQNMETAAYHQLEERTRVLPNPYSKNDCIYVPQDFNEDQYWKDRCPHCHPDVFQGCDPACAKLAPVRGAFYAAYGFPNQNPSGASCLCAPGVICDNCRYRYSLPAEARANMVTYGTIPGSGNAPGSTDHEAGAKKNVDTPKTVLPRNKAESFEKKGQLRTGGLPVWPPRAAGENDSIYYVPRGDCLPKSGEGADVIFDGWDVVLRHGWNGAVEGYCDLLAAGSEANRNGANGEFRVIYK